MIYFGNSQIKNIVLNEQFLAQPFLQNADLFELDGCENIEDLKNNIISAKQFNLSEDTTNRQDLVKNEYVGISDNALKCELDSSNNAGEYVIKTKFATDLFVFSAGLNSDVNSVDVRLKTYDHGNTRLRVKLFQKSGLFGSKTYYAEFYKDENILLGSYNSKDVSAYKISMNRSLSKPYTNRFSINAIGNSPVVVNIAYDRPLYIEVTYHYKSTSVSSAQFYIHHYNIYKGIPQINK